MSEGVEWGVHCCLVLAWLDDLAPLPVGRLAEVFDLPPEYLKKQLQPLAKAGILRSEAGARGGYRLGSDPEAISLMDVVTAIEGGTDPFQCTEIRQRGAGRAAAPGEFAHPCGISKAMRKAELAWRRELASQTLADLIADTPASAERRTRRFIERTA
ncbi:MULTISPECIES: Rrf2 family transcriptional regulator [Haloechinothrix]